MAAPADTTSTPRPTGSPTPVSSFPRLPLTTTFVPPSPDCTGIYSLPSSSGYWWAVYGTHSTCVPSDYTADAGNFFYSPGIVCPSGYQTACYDSAGFSSITTVTCCPDFEPFSCVDHGYAQSLDEKLRDFQCHYRVAETGTAISLTVSEDGKTSRITRTINGAIYAYGIPMVFQATDITGTTTELPETTTATSSTANLAPPSSEPITSSEPESGSRGLSTGAAVGIGVAVPLVVLAALAVGFMFWWRKRKQRRHGNTSGYEPPATAETPSGYAPSGYGPSTLYGPPSQYGPSEMGTAPSPYGAVPSWQTGHEPLPKPYPHYQPPVVHEMPNHPIPTEIGSSGLVSAELPGDFAQGKPQGEK